MNIEINVTDLGSYTTHEEDIEIGNDFLQWADDDNLIEEVKSRRLIDELLDGLTESELAVLGYIKEQ